MNEELASLSNTPNSVPLLPTKNGNGTAIPFPQAITTSAEIDNLSGHIIVCGLYNLGYRIVEQLQKAKIGLVVIDSNPDPQFAQLVEEAGIPLLRQDSRSESVLHRAGIERASALITVVSSDLHNLETTLAATELNPRIRIVTSFFNPQYSERTVKSMSNVRALNVAELTATTFVTASLPSQILHLFEIGPEEFAVVQDKADNAGTVQQTYGPNITPLLRQSKLQAAQICPRPNTPVEKDDLVTVIGGVDQLVQSREVRLNQGEVDAARYGRHSAGRTGKNYKAQQRKKRRVLFTPALFLREMGPTFRRTLITIGLVLLVSTGFFLISNPEKFKADPLTNFISAIYFSLITIGSNATLEDLPGWYNRLYSIGLIVIGTVLLAVIYGYVTNYIVSARLNQLLGRQEATNMEDHVVVCGLGTIGYQVVRGLVERGEAVAVLEQNEDRRFNNLARSLGVPVLHADITNPESLNLVNISKARCIAAMTSDDSKNLETALNALQKKPGLRVVLRLFDARLGGRLEKNFNIQIARSTSALAAPYFIAAALDFKVVTSFYVGQLPFFVAELVIENDGQLNGKTVKSLYTSSGVAVLAYLKRTEKIENHLEGPIKVYQKEPTYHPAPDFPLKAGDTIYFVGSYERITSIYQLNQPPAG